MPRPILSRQGIASVARLTTKATMRALPGCVLAGLMIIMIGCGDSTKSDPVPATGSAANKIPRTGLARETWDAVYMQGTKVGSVHTRVESLTLEGQACLQTSSVQSLTIKRFGEETTFQTEVVSTDTTEGQIRSFRSETRLGPTPQIVAGEYRDGALHVNMTTQGKQLSHEIPCDESQGGFFALEQSLERQPLQPKERRSLTSLLPGLTGVQIVTADLQADALETVELLDGPRELLKIRITMQLGDQQIASVGWMAPDGMLMKLSTPALQQDVYRTTKERAQAEGDGKYDLGKDSVVQVATPLPHPHQLKRAEYRISLDSQNPAKVFASGGSQRIEPEDDRHARLTVLAVRPESDLTGIDEPAAGPADLAASNMIQSDDARVMEMAGTLVAETSSEWDKCLAIEAGVHLAIQAKNFGQGFASAADVAKSLEGDCTEHSVLVAALCRAAGIPARVAFGLVYSARDKGFAFHMWNEAWVAGRWIPLDATLGLGGIGAAHIKLTHSNLTDQGAEAAVLRIIQVINQLEIEVIDFEPK